MKKIRIISLIMALILLLAFCGCGETTINTVKKKTDPTPKPSSSDTDTSEPASEGITSEDDIIGEDGCFLYAIISAAANADISDATREGRNLEEQIGEAFDIMVNTSVDTQLAADSATYEILLGNTNRAESKKALSILKSNRVQNVDDWMVKVIDNKICVVSVSDENLPYAIRYLTVNYCTNLENFAKLTKDFQYIHAPQYEVKDPSKSNFAGNKIGSYTVVTAREKSMLYTLKITELQEILDEKYGIELNSGCDEELKESKYEILVGNTNRALSATYKPQGDNYVIAVTGGKVVVNGGNDAAIAFAFQRILDMELDARNAKKAFVLPGGFKEEGKATSANHAYTLSWADEFNFFDTSIWSNPLGGESSSPSPNGGTTYNRGIKNVTVRDGNLVLPGNRLNKTDFDSSAAHSYNAFAYRYGIVEIRMKLAPTPLVSCIWGERPSFSMVNGVRSSYEVKNRLELDVLENFGQKDWFSSNVHHWWVDGSKHTSLDGSKYAEQKKYTYSDPDKFAEQYHIFSYEWTPYGFKFAVDGDVYFEYDASTVSGNGYFQVPIDIKLTAGYSSAEYYLQKKYGDDAPEHGEALVDYVRVYQCDKYDNILWLSPVKD